MSHFTQVRTNIRDFDILEEAARSFGCEVARNAVARGYDENRLQAQMVIIPPESPYDVAANRENDGQISLTTDWFNGHVEKVLGAQFGLLRQRYSLIVIKREASALLANVSEEVLEDGRIRLKVRGAA